MIETRIKKTITLLGLTAAFLVACSSDDDSIASGDVGESSVSLTQVFNKFELEDRTDGEADVNPSGIDNGYVSMLRDGEDGKYYLNFTNFQNIGENIDFSFPDIRASRFAVFLTTAGASLSTQNNFDNGDLPIYIGTIDENGELKLRLTPEEVTGNSVTIGGKTISVRNTSDVMLTSEGDVKMQRSTGSRKAWYDWVVLHPFQGEELRPTIYPSIVADLDADNQLDQNVTLIYNKFALEDRTDGDAEANPSGIKNDYASIVEYNDATYIRLNNFQNIEQSIDRNFPDIEASRFAVFLTTAGASLATQNNFDEGARPVYIGELTTNGFNDLELKPGTGNETGTVEIGANRTEIKTNPSILLENGFISQQTSTGGIGVLYDWIVLHPFQGDDLRPINYPGIVADLDGTNEL